MKKLTNTDREVLNNMHPGDIKYVSRMLIQAVPFTECPECEFNPYGLNCLTKGVCCGDHFNRRRLMFKRVDQLVEDL